MRKIRLIQPSFLGTSRKSVPQMLVENMQAIQSMKTSSPRRSSLKTLERKQALKPTNLRLKLDKSNYLSPPEDSFSSTLRLSRGELNCSRTLASSRLDNEASLIDTQRANPTSILEKSGEVLGLPERSENLQPMHPSAAVKKHGSVLTAYELKEISEFDQVYFIAPNANKIQADPDRINQGYDNERGFYRIVIGDHIAFRYEVLSIIGRGSFGQVVKAFDYKRNETVAIKIIRNSVKLAKQAGIEIKLLNLIRTKDAKDERNVVKMKNYFVFRNHVCISFELLSLNLYEFLRKNQFQGMQLSMIRRIAVQILISLTFLKSLNIIHCDLKPENVVLKQPNKSSIKLIDFGSSSMVDQTIYNYIQSRYYRAPEVILQLRYNRAIDMWSLGCILAELYKGTPLFSGDTELQVITRMQEVLGQVPQDIVAKSRRRTEFFTKELTPMMAPDAKGKVSTPGSIPLTQALNCEDLQFIDFLHCCFAWDPSERMQPDCALRHPWIVGENVNSSFLLDSSSVSKSAKRRLSRSMRK
mmetsp:Transcript_34638/g.60911  ORF Transcript_34638/g.60911 Transcript_34638/m.60911 type:complete len:527 (+) Transcript_34638:301-1881(+)